MSDPKSPVRKSQTESNDTPELTPELQALVAAKVAEALAAAAPAAAPAAPAVTSNVTDRSVVDPSDPRNGYYRTTANRVVKRRYMTGSDDYLQNVVEGPNGELPEGLTNKDIKND